MSITISNSIFNRLVSTAPNEQLPAVFLGLNEMGLQPKAPVLALKLMDVRRALDQRYKDFCEVRNEGIKERATKDDEGKPIISETGTPEMTDEAKAEYGEYYTKLCEVTFDLPCGITRADILGLREVSENTLYFLGDILIAQEVVESETVKKKSKK